ncbi:MAG: glycosyltransferase [Eubacterium sp.]|nr:glycosyltransferase [Eubacterium sp.]
MKPVLSVIIPVYNRDRFLERCVKSVEASTLKNIEIILIDDGSVDNSGVLCDKLAQEDSRILVIHQQNAGVSAARNRGLERAQGKYFAFVDSDDYIEPDMYEKMIAAMEENNADMVCCGISKEYEIEERVEKLSNNHLDAYVDAVGALKLLLAVSWSASNSISTMSANKVGKKCLQVEKQIFFNEELYECEDGAFWCDYIVTIRKAVLLNEVFYHYVIHENNVSANWDINKSKLSNLVAWNHIIQKCAIVSEQLGCIAESRYQIYLRKMIFEVYCIHGSSDALKNLLPQLKRYRKQLYQAKELSFSRKIYYFGCGMIVKYNLGRRTAMLWKRAKETFKSYAKK